MTIPARSGRGECRNYGVAIAISKTMPGLQVSLMAPKGRNKSRRLWMIWATKWTRMMRSTQLSLLSSHRQPEDAGSSSAPNLRKLSEGIGNNLLRKNKFRLPKLRNLGRMKRKVVPSKVIYLLLCIPSLSYTAQLVALLSLEPSVKP